MWATVERMVLLRWILDVCLVTCITPNCATAPWEAVRLSDRKFFQPHCWPNICSGLLAEEQLLLVCPTLYKILNNHVKPMHESSNTGSVGETPSVSLAHFMYIHFHQFVHIFLLAHLKKNPTCSLVYSFTTPAWKSLLLHAALWHLVYSESANFYTILFTCYQWFAWHIEELMQGAVETELRCSVNTNSAFAFNSQLYFASSGLEETN